MSPSLPRESIHRYVTAQDVANVFFLLFWEIIHRYVTAQDVANISFITSRDYSEVRNCPGCGKCLPHYIERDNPRYVTAQIVANVSRITSRESIPRYVAAQDAIHK